MQQRPGLFREMLTDGTNNTISSRRVVTFFAFLLCAIAFIADLLYDIKMEKFIFDSMSYIAIAGLGATVAEKFAGNTYNSRDHYDDRCSQQNNYYNRPRSNRIPPSHDPLI